jgi:hypothetical protein
MFGVPVYLIYLAFVAGCASPKSTSTSNTSPAGGAYTEDLSVLRPKVEAPKDTVVRTTDRTKPTTYVEPKFAINEKLDTVLDSIDRMNLSRKFVEGYTIQVYSGRREQALDTRKQLSNLLPEIDSEVQFTEPIFRVKAGKYFNWMDAQGDFTLIKKYFPAAIIIPDRIPLNSSL